MLSTDIQSLFVFLLFVSGAVTEFVEQIKKQVMLTVFKGASELTPTQQSIFEAIILVSRFVGGLVGILILGGYQTLFGLLPFFSKLPEIGVLLLSAFLIGLGSDAIYTMLGFVKSLGMWVGTPTQTNTLKISEVSSPLKVQS